MSTSQEFRTSEIWSSATKKPNPIPYSLPDLSFCPKCGSLEVFFSLSDSQSIKGQCLDCKYNWIREGIDS